MCGIAGIIARRSVNRQAVQTMINAIAHRGPDGEGIWSSDDGKVMLGHRRLAIIDPTPAGAQPMVDPSGQLVLTFNGEIYNYLELAERLTSEGQDFRSTSDTEVLLAAMDKWGDAALSEMNGMFAFALFDHRRGKLICARDWFGEKPLLYVETPEFFAFASEYKALLSLAEVALDVDEDRLLRFLHQPRRGLDDERETAFGAIKQLLPGEYLSVDATTLAVEITRYWTPGPDADLARLSEPDAVSRFRELLSDSVAIRMRSDVPVGSCLSGGLDSSSIVCLNRRHLGPDKAYHVFTGRFPGTAADEWSFADEVIRANDVESHVVEPSAQGFMDELPEFMWLNELPVGSSSQYAQWCVFRLAKSEGVTVLLDGQGADEILAGYEQYFLPYLRACADTSDQSEEQAIRARYPAALLSGNRERLSKLPLWMRHRLANMVSRGSDFLFGLNADAAARIGDSEAQTASSDLNPLTAALLEDAFHAHLPTLLRYGDRNSMAHSREVRLPFCDHRIAELALSVPPEYLMGGAETKRILRRGMEGILPEKIRTRWNKQGFLPPQDDWFRDRLLVWAEETIADRSFAERGVWNVNWWRRVIDRLKAGEQHLAWPLWKPLIGETWYRHFLDRVKAMPKVPALAEPGAMS